MAEVARKRGWPILEFNSRGRGGLLGQVRSLLGVEGIRFIFTSVVPNFINFGPVGIIIVARNTSHGGHAPAKPASSPAVASPPADKPAQ